MANNRKVVPVDDMGNEVAEGTEEKPKKKTKAEILEERLKAEQEREEAKKKKKTRVSL
jgi:hypothetical protein